VIRTRYDAPETPRPPDWRALGACRQHDEPDLWFASGSSADGIEARSICGGCPVVQACGQWALDNREPVGVWGGMTEAERRTILRRRGIRLLDTQEPKPAKPRPKRKSPEPAVCGTDSGYRKHVREKTKICDPCRQAHAEADALLRRTGTTKVPA
jgi:hypothetical protein